MSITLGETLRTLELPFVRLTETRHAAGLTLAAHEHTKANINFVLRHGFAECIDGRDFYCRVGGVLIKPAGVRHWNRYGASRRTHCSSSSLLNSSDRHAYSPTSGTRKIRDSPRLPRSSIVRCERPTYPRHSPFKSSSWSWWRILAARRFRDTCAAAARSRHARGGWNPGRRCRSARGKRFPAHLMRSFRRHFRCSMGEYVRRRRIREAQRLLADDDTPLARIALQAGFYDQSHFTRTFKRLTRMTPSEYRRVLAS